MATPTLNAPPTQRGRTTRRAVLEAALAEFGAKGFHAASVSSITQRANVAQGTFYLYFPSKEAIYAAVVAHASDCRVTFLKEHEDCQGTDVRAVGRLIDFAEEQPLANYVLRESQFVDRIAFSCAQRALFRYFADHFPANGPVTHREERAHQVMARASHSLTMASLLPVEKATA